MRLQFGYDRARDATGQALSFSGAHYDTPALGVTIEDISIGSFSGSDGLPPDGTAITDYQDYQDDLFAMLNKTTEISNDPMGLEVSNVVGSWNVFGGAGGDYIHAGLSTTGSGEVHGGAGDDTVNGGGGSGFFYGEAGDDHLYAGRMNARLDGGEGRDSLVANAGIDTLYGGAMGDSIYGDKKGEDAILWNAAADSAPDDMDAIHGFKKTDKLVFSAEFGKVKWGGLVQEGDTLANHRLSYSHGADGDTYLVLDNNHDGQADFTVEIDGIKAIAHSEVISYFAT